MELNIVYGDIAKFPPHIIEFVNKYVKLLDPIGVHICDGSEVEKKSLIEKMIKTGTLEPLPKYDNCYLARTSPKDVARVEKMTFICTPEKKTCVPEPLDASKGQLGNWANDKEMREKLQHLLKGGMKGRIMYVLPFCMGTPGSEFSKLGIQLTDSAYVVVSMGIMTTMGDSLLKYLKTWDVVYCVHTVLCPKSATQSTLETLEPWACNPEKVLICHFPNENEIVSCGSGYGGNSLLGKKCFALRIANTIAYKEGWLAEHMLILKIEKDKQKKYVAAAFPSACGKTNLALLTPTIPGWDVKCVGDDIAWLRFDKNGQLRAMNPERGFFGVAPGTSETTNPIAMKTIFRNTIFTNVAKTSDGGVYWEGMDLDIKSAGITITDWLGNENWTPDCGHTAAHPNSRFCTPIQQCPNLDSQWDDPKGVPIDIIIFGGRRPKGVPLVVEALNWNQGVYFGAAVKSETTSAASDVKANIVTHDPMAMRPFFGYNICNYFQHWFDIAKVPGRILPKIFHVNWFRKNDEGKFLWPGFGENIRVLDYMFRRCNGEDIAVETPIGLVPKPGSINIDGLSNLDLATLLHVDKEFYKADIEEIDDYFKQFLNKEYPEELKAQVELIRGKLA